MKVYLFDDYLKSIHGPELTDKDVVAEIEPIDDFPSGLIRIDGRLAASCSLGSDRFFIRWVDEPKCEDEAYCCDEIECPHCGYIHRDSWEFEDEGEMDCGQCGTLFSYSRYVSVSYSSQVIKRNEEITELK